VKIGIVGCGYVGQAAALYWKQKGHHIAVTTRQPERVAFLQSLADSVTVLNSGALETFVSQQEALLISVAPDRFSDYASTYLHTAKQIAEQARDSDLKHLFYTSSTSIYGDYGGAWIDEITPLKHDHENGKILSETEQVLLGCTSKDLKVCILRLGEIYGPGREIENRLRRMQNQSFAGTGHSYTNLVHLTDIVMALDFALQHNLNGIYNLCNDFHIPRNLFYEKLCQKEQIPPIKWDHERSNFHQGNKRVSNQKIKNVGFSFTHPNY
jgi:nucleoside-diphosphate-sugar epimerase